MTLLDDRVAVFRIAMLSDDLTRGELAALKRVAEKLEREWNQLTSINLERRLNMHGPIDLFGEWESHRELAGLAVQERSKNHAAWWRRFSQRWAEYLHDGPRALGPRNP